MASGCWPNTAAATDSRFNLTTPPDKLVAGETRASFHSFPSTLLFGSQQSLPGHSNSVSANPNLSLHILQHQPTGRAIEDRFSVQIVPVRDSSSVRVLLGVYDGHRGPWAADYVAKSLPPELQTIFSRPASECDDDVAVSPGADVSTQRTCAEQSSKASADLSTVFERLDRQIIASFQDDCTLPPSPPSRWLRPIFHALKPGFLNQAQSEQSGRLGQVQADTSKAPSALRALSGCTASVLCLDIFEDPSQSASARLINLGDSRTVVASLSSGAIFAVTADVNSSTTHERSLIISQHPTDDPDDIFVGGRLFGDTLSTRSFGDAMYKLPLRSETTTGTYSALTQGQHKIHKHLIAHLGAHDAAARLSAGTEKVIPLTDRYSAMFSRYKSPPYVSPKPDIISLSLADGAIIKSEMEEDYNQESLLAILATDGLWDLVSSEEAVNIARDAIIARSDLQQAEENIAQMLLDKVVETKNRKAADDVTIIVLVLKLS